MVGGGAVIGEAMRAGEQGQGAFRCRSVLRKWSVHPLSGIEKPFTPASDGLKRRCQLADGAQGRTPYTRLTRFRLPADSAGVVLVGSR